MNGQTSEVIGMTKGLRLRLALAATAAVAAGWVVPALPASATTTTTGDWVTVTQAMVDKLGGVNVSGQVSCEGTYQKIVAGKLRDSNGNLVPIDVQPSDKVNLLANNDNYTVSQPSGRKSMIQLTHSSSRMNPCFLQYRFLPDGTPMPNSVSCASDGYPCRWETDIYGYDHDSLGPLFDYSNNGKFKAGTLNVYEQSVGLLVMVAHFSGDTVTGWSSYFVSEGSFSTTSTSLKAVSYRA